MHTYRLTKGEKFWNLRKDARVDFAQAYPTKEAALAGAALYIAGRGGGTLEVQHEDGTCDAEIIYTTPVDP